VRTGNVAAPSALNHPLNLIVHQGALVIGVGCPVIVKPVITTPLSCIDFVSLARRSGKADGQALLACGQAEPESHMGLARAAGTKRNDILAPLDPFATGQFQHLHLVEPVNGDKIEAVQAFDDQELGGLMRRSTLRRSVSIISLSTSRARYPV
jgi:hypothetical protein